MANLLQAAKAGGMTRIGKVIAKKYKNQQDKWML